MRSGELPALPFPRYSFTAAFQFVPKLPPSRSHVLSVRALGLILTRSVPSWRPKKRATAEAMQGVVWLLSLVLCPVGGCCLVTSGVSPRAPR